MKKLLCLFLLIPTLALAQSVTRTPAFIGAATTVVAAAPAGYTSPTNLASVTGYWVANDSIQNEVNVITNVPDRAAGLGAYTNSSGDPKPAFGPNLNGLKTLKFGTSSEVLYKPGSISQPFTFWCVWAQTNFGAGNLIGISGNRISPMRDSSGIRTRMNAGSLVYFELSVTNKWITQAFVVNGIGSATYTNGISAVTGDVGTGAFSDINIVSPFGVIAEWAFFSTALSATDIANLHAFGTNKYEISP